MYLLYVVIVARAKIRYARVNAMELERIFKNVLTSVDS